VNERTARWVVPLGVAAVTFTAFLPALHADFVNLDDHYLLLRNGAWRGSAGYGFGTVHGGHYHPLTWLSWRLDYAMWGLEPRGYHLTNMLLHAAGAAALVVLLRMLLGVGSLAAAAGALLRSAHPLRVESVAWVTERRDVLSALLLMLTVIAYVSYARGGDRRWLWASIALYALSLLAKAWGMTLPVVLLLIDAYPLRRRALPEKIPFAALALGAAVAALVAQRSEGAMVTLGEHTLVDRLLQAPYALGFYAWKTAVPFNLSPLYLRGGDVSGWAWLPVALVPAATLLIVLRRRSWPGLFAAWVLGIVIVSPVLGLAQSGPQLVADRYTHLAALPICAVAAAVLARATPLGAGVAGLAVAALCAVTREQTKVWRDSVTLWTRAIEHDSRNYWAYSGRGRARLDSGDARGAIPDPSESIRLKPTYAEAWNNRGLARQRLGDAKGAIADYDEAVAHAPRMAQAFVNRGAARAALGDSAGGIADIQTAIALDPGLADAYRNRAVWRLQSGDVDGALADCTRAIELAPHDGLAYSSRAVVRHAKGDVKGALLDHDEAVRLAPRQPEVRFNRAIARQARGDPRGAVADFDAAIVLEPRRPDLRYSRGLLRQEAGDPAGALADFDEALKVAPADWQARPIVEEARARLAPKKP